jgi:RNA polymerase sigma factor (sigma-70 family)
MAHEYSQEWKTYRDKVCSYDGFSDLVSRYQKKFYGMCLNIVGNEEDAEDALQNALTHAWDKSRTFMGRSPPSHWLHTVVRKSALEVRRKREARYLREKQLRGSEEIIEAPPFSYDPHERLKHSQISAATVAAFASMKPRNSNLLFLYAEQENGTRIRTVAVKLGVSHDTVKSRVYDAKEDLLKHLGRSARKHKVSFREMTPFI